MRVTFDEVSMIAVKKWTDENGKKRQKTKKFCQTINPFNKNARSEVKTRAEIYEEIKRDRRAWLDSDSRD